MNKAFPALLLTLSGTFMSVSGCSDSKSAPQMTASSGQAVTGLAAPVHDPHVMVSYPTTPNYAPRDVDCGTLIKVPAPQDMTKIQRVVITCEFGQAVDPNNQNVCISGPTNPNDPSSVAQSYTDAFLHYATGHNMCVVGNPGDPSSTGYVDALRNLMGKSESEILGHSSEHVRKYQSWSGDCPLTRARNQCIAQYKGMGLWAPN